MSARSRAIAAIALVIVTLWAVGWIKMFQHTSHGALNFVTFLLTIAGAIAILAIVNTDPVNVARGRAAAAALQAEQARQRAEFEAFLDSMTPAEEATYWHQRRMEDIARAQLDVTVIAARENHAFHQNVSWASGYRIRQTRR